MAGKITSIRFSDELLKFFEKENIDPLTPFVVDVLERYIRGELVAPQSDLEELRKQKLAIDIEITKLKAQALEARKVIDQANNLKVRILAATAEHKELRNELLRKQLDKLPGTSGHLVSKEQTATAAAATNNGTTEIIRKFYQCNYCQGKNLPQGVITFWKNEGTDKNPRWRLYEWDGYFETPHRCNPVKTSDKDKATVAKEAPAVRQANDFAVKCSECSYTIQAKDFAHEQDFFGSMNDNMQAHVRHEHGRAWLVESEQADHVAGQPLPGGWAPSGRGQQ